MRTREQLEKASQELASDLQEVGAMLELSDSPGACEWATRRLKRLKKQQDALDEEIAAGIEQVKAQARLAELLRDLHLVRE